MPPAKPASKEPVATVASELYAATEIAGIQKLLGGIPVGTVTAVYGAPEAGKSTLTAQLGVEFAVAHDGNAMIHDTELNQHTFVPLMQRLKARFGEDFLLTRVKPIVSKKKSKNEDERYEVEWKFLTPAPSKGQRCLFLIQSPDIHDITHLYGRGALIQVSEGGKVDIDLLTGSWAATPGDIPLGRFMDEHNVKSLVIDSVTNPLDEIPAKTKNFPGRSDLTQLWLIQAMKLAWHRDMPVFIVAHETKNDAGAFSKELDIEGGKGVRYNVKHVLYVLIKNERGLLPGNAERPTKQLADTGRYVYGHRVPGKKSWGHYAMLDLTERGFDDYKD